MKSLLSFIFIGSFICLHAQEDIFEAARKGDTVRIGVLLKLKRDTINSHNESGFTPLIISGYRYQMKTVEFLLRQGADINASSPEGTVLIAACYKGNYELADLLLKHGADVNAKNDTGTNALIFAVQSNNLALVRLLLQYKAKKDQAENSGRTALDYARLYGFEEIIKLLSE